MLDIKNLDCFLQGFSLTDINFRVAEGEYFILLGESGAGKSVLLEVLAGLTQVSNGLITLDGENITRKRIQDRNIGLVFQDQAIFPHLSVYQNIAYPLKGKYQARNEKEKIITEIAELLQISKLLHQHPSVLSGGELQRVALARSLVQKPRVLLLDEPLSATDTKLRNELRSLLRHINKQGQTIIHVTHDFDEAVSLADHIAIMRMGQIIQTGTPQEVFGKPRNSFVAHFTGISNFFKAEIIQEESKCIAFIKPGIKLFSTENCESATASIIIRNNDILLSAAQAESSALNNFEARIVDFYPSRNGTEVVVDAGIVLHAQISADSASRLGLQIGKSIWVQFKASSVKIIPD